MQNDISSLATNTQPPLPIPPQPPRKKRWLVVVAICVTLVAAVTTCIVLYQFKASHSVTITTGDASKTIKAAESLSAAYDTFAKSGIKEFTAADKQVILQSYDELASGFTFNKGFLDDAATQLHALGIAYLYHTHPEKKSIYRDELYLLAISYLDTLPSGIVDANFVPASDSDKAAADVLLGYRDDALSSRVEHAAQFQTALDTAVKKLKISDVAHLSSYKVVAYNFTTDDAQFTELTSKHNMYGARPMMWVEGIGGTAYIMMMKDYAQDVIDGNKNSLTHEFIHTQQPFIRGETGRVVEERRAEYLSGDTSAYYDAKQLFIYLKVLGDIDGLSLLDEHPTDAGSFFIAVYSKLGIIGGNALTYSWPSVFLSDAQGAMEVVAAENNLDVVMQRALAIGASDQKALDARLQQRFDKLVQVLGSKEQAIEHVQSISEMYGLPTVQKEFVRYLKAKGVI